MKVFLEFHKHGKFEKRLNDFHFSYSKKMGTIEVKDFRPMSLVSGIYKIIVKVLANRLKTVLANIISKTHNGFIRGCQILDFVLITNEYIDSRLKSGVLCKLDLEKVYAPFNLGGCELGVCSLSIRFFWVLWRGRLFGDIFFFF